MSNNLKMEELVEVHKTLSYQMGRNSIRLQISKIPSYIYDFIISNDYSKLMMDIKQELTPENYRNKFETLLNLEHAYQTIDLHRFDQFGKSLIADEPDIYSMDRPQFSNEKLQRSNTVILRQCSMIYLGFVESINERQIRIKRHFKSQPFPGVNGIFDVLWIKAERAIEDYLEILAHHRDTPFNRSILFPSGQQVSERKSFNLESGDQGCILDNIDDAQRGAVIDILGDDSQPAPYIIYGPPGTGKTRTLMEIILRVHRKRRYFKILVCTLFNECIDELVIKILKTGEIDSRQLVRVVPPKRKIPENELLRGASKSRRENFRSHSVVATTYGIASKIGLKFDYVLFDEAHRFREPEALVLRKMVKPEGCFVMVGDAQLPGPVCIYPVARDHGLGKSMLERLCQSPAYQGSPRGAVYTKLTTCYRSDPRLMALNNELFYNNELKCLATTPQKYLDMLDVSSPLVYEAIQQAEEEQDLKTLCWFNVEEVDICLKYIRLFQSNDIDVEKQVGIIAPCKAQVENLYDAIERENLPKCKIGSARKFSGEERDIILISAVRTRSDPDSEFLFDPKQFNLATSRSRSLMILIGHTETLSSSEYWKLYVERAEHVSGD